MLHIPLWSFDLLSRTGVENIHREGQKQRKRAGAAASKRLHQPVASHRVTHLVAFFQQELSQVRSILGRVRYRKMLETH